MNCRSFIYLRTRWNLSWLTVTKKPLLFQYVNVVKFIHSLITFDDTNWASSKCYNFFFIINQVNLVWAHWKLYLSQPSGTGVISGEKEWKRCSIHSRFLPFTKLMLYHTCRKSFYYPHTTKIVARMYNENATSTLMTIIHQMSQLRYNFYWQNIMNCHKTKLITIN